MQRTPKTAVHIQDILKQFVEPTQLESSIKAFGVLNVDFLNGMFEDFLAIVLPIVPVHPWSAMVVALQSKPAFVSISVAHRMEFKDIMHGFLNTNYAPPISFHLQLDVDVKNTQGLVCNDLCSRSAMDSGYSE